MTTSTTDKPRRPGRPRGSGVPSVTETTETETEQSPSDTPEGDGEQVVETERRVLETEGFSDAELDEGLVETTGLSEHEVADLSKQMAAARAKSLQGQPRHAATVPFSAEIDNTEIIAGLDAKVVVAAPAVDTFADASVAAGVYVEADAAQVRRPAPPVSAIDDLDALMGTAHRRGPEIFEWARARDTGFSLTFSRLYFDIGVLVDRFANPGTATQLDVRNKILAIKKRNEEVEPERRLGYLAYIVGRDPSAELVGRAKAKELVIAFQLVGNPHSFERELGRATVEYAGPYPPDTTTVPLVR